jgi:hypothetical protein
MDYRELGRFQTRIEAEAFLASVEASSAVIASASEAIQK